MTQIIAVEESLEPVSPNNHAYLMVDGACLKGGLRQLYRMGLEEVPALVLQDGIHDGVSLLGPMLISLSHNSALADHWSGNHPSLEKAAVIHTHLKAEELLKFFRARVQVVAPDGGILWLRLADARVIARVAVADSLLPDAFWAGVGAVFYRSAGAVRCYRPAQASTVQNDLRSAVVSPFFRFTEALFAALEPASEAYHMEVL